MKSRLLCLLAGTVAMTCGCSESDQAAQETGQLLQSADVAGTLSASNSRWRVDMQSREFGGAANLPDPGIPVVDEVPLGFRQTLTLGEEAWLQAEIYTRRENAAVGDFLSVVPDPDNPEGQVLRLSSIEHTDGVMLRSAEPLPKNYRISFRIGHIDFGGEPPLNGYTDGDERGGPWMDILARNHNGVYWGAIMDTPPQPNNNIWSHHHRKFFMDAWNYRGRMRGVTVAGVMGTSRADPKTGKSFIAHDGDVWNEYSATPALFYMPKRWYRVVIERNRGTFRFSINGEFKDRGYATAEGELNAEDNCLYHYNRSSRELDDACLIRDYLDVGERRIDLWPEGSAYPDYFMLGDPHINFYEGSVLVDDLRLETL